MNALIEGHVEIILNRAIQAIMKKNEAILRYLSAHSLISLEMSFFLQCCLFSR